MMTSMMILWWLLIFIMPDHDHDRPHHDGGESIWRSGKDVGTSTFISPLLKVERGKGWIAWEVMVMMMMLTVTMMMTMMMVMTMTMMMVMKALCWWDGFIVFIAVEERLRAEVREGSSRSKESGRIIPGVLGWQWWRRWWQPAYLRIQRFALGRGDLLTNPLTLEFDFLNYNSRKLLEL